MHKHVLPWCFCLVVITVSAANPKGNPKIPRLDYTRKQNEKILEQVNSLGKKDAECVWSFKKAYQKSLFDYCEKTGKGANVGGGCHHTAYAWSLHSGVTVKAFEKCKIGLNKN